MRPRDTTSDPGASPTTIVVMGVSASGKSTVMRALADALGWPTAEGDDFHPSSNVDTMRAGMPLTDDDRWPWLRAIADWIGGREAAGTSSIVTCSALRRAYRDVLRLDRPSVWFAHLVASADRLEARIEARTGHFMPPDLLRSQFATLEPLEADEPGDEFDATASPDQIVARIVRTLAATGRMAVGPRHR